jgi:hypothetical protein
MNSRLHWNVELLQLGIGYLEYSNPIANGFDLEQQKEVGEADNLRTS